MMRVKSISHQETLADYVPLVRAVRNSSVALLGGQHKANAAGESQHIGLGG